MWSAWQTLPWTSTIAGVATRTRLKWWTSYQTRLRQVSCSSRDTHLLYSDGFANSVCVCCSCFLLHGLNTCYRSRLERLCVRIRRVWIWHTVLYRLTLRWDITSNQSSEFVFSGVLWCILINIESFFETSEEHYYRNVTFSGYVHIFEAYAVWTPV